MVNFPSSLDALANPTATTNRDDPGFALHTVISWLNDIAEILEAKVGIGATTPARGTALVAGAAGASVWDRFARKNLLIGGSAQLWDQGTSPAATDNAYIGGNWRVLMEAANACTIAREATDLPTSGARFAWKLIAGSGNNNKFGIFQVIEGADIWDLRSSAASLQAALKIGGTPTPIKAAICVWTGSEDATTGDPISSWGAAGTNPTLAAGWAYVGTPVDLAATTSWVTYYPTENGAISASATNLAVFVWVDDKTTTQTTDFLLVTDVQLERGAVCTAVERRKLEEEQMLDARYYTKTFDPTVAPAQNIGSFAGCITYRAQVAGVSNQGAAWRFPVPMRATPTLTFYSPGAATTAWYSASASVASGASSALATGIESTFVTNAQAAGDTVGALLCIHATASSRI